MNGIPAQPSQVPIQQTTQPDMVEVVKESVDKEFPPRYTFYTGKSALTIELSRDYDAIIWQLANSIGEKRFDWDNKIAVKMGIEEVDNIISVLEAYLQGGAQGFGNVARFLQPKNQQQGTLSFYHKAPSGKTTSINVGLNQGGIPFISVHRTETDGSKKSVYFAILPTAIRTFIRILDRFADIVISQPTKPYGQRRNNNQQNQPNNGAPNQPQQLPPFGGM